MINSWILYVVTAKFSTFSAPLIICCCLPFTSCVEIFLSHLLYYALYLGNVKFHSDIFLFMQFLKAKIHNAKMTVLQLSCSEGRR